MKTRFLFESFPLKVSESGLYTLCHWSVKRLILINLISVQMLELFTHINRETKAIFMCYMPSYLSLIQCIRLRLMLQFMNIDQILKTPTAAPSFLCGGSGNAQLENTGCWFRFISFVLPFQLSAPAPQNSPLVCCNFADFGISSRSREAGKWRRSDAMTSRHLKSCESWDTRRVQMSDDPARNFYFEASKSDFVVILMSHCISASSASSTWVRENVCALVGFIIAVVDQSAPLLMLVF